MRREDLFQSTPSARRATLCFFRAFFSSLISIHALREEGDPARPAVPLRCVLFQSTPSARRATPPGLADVCGTLISIHALREEGDSKSGEKIHHVCSIIHTCAQFEKELYEGSGEMQNKSC